MGAITLLPGCGSVAIKTPLSRQIPDPPAYLHPVAVLKPQAGESPVVDAERQEAGLRRANGIIVRARRAWIKLQKAYK